MPRKRESPVENTLIDRYRRASVPRQHAQSDRASRAISSKGLRKNTAYSRIGKPRNQLKLSREHVTRMVYRRTRRTESQLHSAHHTYRRQCLGSEEAAAGP